MLYRFHSDASYLSEPGARSRAAGLHYLTNAGENPPINGPVAVLSQVLDVVVSSSCEAEYGALFTNGRLGVPIRNTLEDLGYPQPPTVGEVDNKIATQLVNDEAKQKRTKAVDMRYHWMRDRVRQGQFKILWREGTSNLADFPSKIHPTSHFLAMRKFYVSYPSSANSVPREGVLKPPAGAPPSSETPQPPNAATNAQPPILADDGFTSTDTNPSVIVASQAPSLPTDLTLNYLASHIPSNPSFLIKV